MIESLFTVTLLELFIGGGGRLLDFGPVTVRMILFLPCLAIGYMAVLARRRLTGGQALALALAGGFLLTHLPAMFVGAVKSADIGDMFREFQQSLYWIGAPFFALALDSERMVLRAASLVRIAGVVLAVGYIGVLVGAVLGEVDIFSLYLRVNESGEFIGRGEGMFFYKGFLYLGVAVVFLVALRGRYWFVLSLLVGSALVLTLTRGFLLSTTVAILLLLAVQGRTAALLTGLILSAIVAFGALVYAPSMNEGLAASRDESNNQRVVDTRYIAEHVSAETFLWGEGFGTPINDRSAIENSFLLVFWKLGLIGLAFWILPLVLCSYYFAHVPRGAEHPLACAFFFGVVLIYVQTITNPYLTNPIGLSFVMVALFSLRTLARHASGRARLQALA